MKKSIILFVAALNFPALEINTHAGKPVNDNWMPFGNGFSSSCHYNLNTPGKQGHLACPALGYFNRTQVYWNVIFIPRDQDTDPFTAVTGSGEKGAKGALDTSTLEVTDWCTESFPDSINGSGDEAGNDLIALVLIERSRTASFFSYGITLNRISARI